MHKQNRQPVVGFYKDKKGETRPITKSVAELNRTKIVQRPQQFRGVNPQIQAEREKQMRERQRVKLEQNVNGMRNLLQRLNQSLESRGHAMEGLKKEYEMAQQQQEPKKALQIQQRMSKLLFIVTALAKKRDAVQNNIQALEQAKVKLQ